MMRQATWQAIEGSPFWHSVYRKYRELPEPVRAGFRALFSPDLTAATWLVTSSSHSAVVSGPFTGMKLKLSPLSARHLLGYILGTQELELSDIVERVVQKGYPSIVNVGAADGYYAVGLARRCPQARVTAYEALDELHETIRESAALNDVSPQIEVRGKCEPSDLDAQLHEASKPTLVLMDIEGGELGLLDPERIPALRNVDILVETHDMFAQDCTAIIAARFEATHEVEHRSSRPRALSDFPAGFVPVLPRLFPKLAVDLMDERRAGVQDWLYLTARDQG